MELNAGADVDFSEFADRMETVLDAVRMTRDIKRDILDRAGVQLLGTVQGHIGGTGKMQSWQDVRRGSGGGYAAVSPRPKTFANGYRVGQITEAIERGHRIRSPSGRAQRYKPKIKHPNGVPGQWYYKSSEPDAAAIAKAAGDELAAAIVRAMEA